MKKRTFILLNLVLIAVAAWAQPLKTATPQAAADELPAVTVTQTDGSPLQLQTLKGDVVIILFNSQCDHCQHEAQSILEKKHLFKNKQLYFVSAESMDLIKRFITDYKMTEPNFHFSHAEPAQVYQGFGNFRAIPAIFVYRNKKRIGKFESTTAVEDIANVFSVK
jgi:peroxiredoxin